MLENRRRGEILVVFKNGSRVRIQEPSPYTGFSEIVFNRIAQSAGRALVRILAPGPIIRGLGGGVALQRLLSDCGNSGQRNLRVTDSQLF